MLRIEELKLTEGVAAFPLQIHKTVDDPLMLKILEVHNSVSIKQTQLKKFVHPVSFLKTCSTIIHQLHSSFVISMNGNTAI